MVLGGIRIIRVAVILINNMVLFINNSQINTILIHIGL